MTKPNSQEHLKTGRRLKNLEYSLNMIKSKAMMNKLRVSSTQMEKTMVSKSARNSGLTSDQNEGT